MSNVYSHSTLVELHGKMHLCTALEGKYRTGIADGDNTDVFKMLKKHYTKKAISDLTRCFAQSASAVYLVLKEPAETACV